MPRLTLSIVTAAAALALSASAMASPPVNRAVWAKAASTWTAQAKAHGATASCMQWRSGGVTDLGCDFGARGRVSVTRTAEACVYRVLVYFPSPRFPRFAHTDLNSCAKGWWARPLPAPWTFPK